MRYAGIYEALRDANYLLDDLRRACAPSEPRNSTIVIETFDICALLRAQCAAIQGLAEAKDVRVVYDPCGQKHDDCMQFRGDATRVDQVLRNVLINAVRYTPPGGEVDIECRGLQTGRTRDLGSRLRPGNRAGRPAAHFRGRFSRAVRSGRRQPVSD